MSRKTKSKNRNLNLELYSSLYSFRTFGDRLSCAYCGDVREGVDHIPPLSVVASVTPAKLRKLEVDLISVPCCSTCNGTLGGRKIGTYEERLHFLYSRLQAKLESSVFWSNDEIDELSGNLRVMVLSKQLQLRRECLLRLRGMERSLSRLKNDTF